MTDKELIRAVLKFVCEHEYRGFNATIAGPSFAESWFSKRRDGTHYPSIEEVAQEFEKEQFFKQI